IFPHQPSLILLGVQRSSSGAR
ncbi:hypothetical protein CMV_023728, partial [Castanea mollissima]